MPSINDLFCGCGGMGLGFKQAGFKTVGAWDFDKYAVMSYKTNVDDVVTQSDITKMTANDLPYADVWTFGFPCQDISAAGKQAGMIKGETRSGLFYEVMRLLDETKDKPKIILAENVKAVKKYLPEIEKKYNEQGYKMTAQLYNSKHWGVPQNRERYFIVGVREDIEKEFIFPEQQTEFVPKLTSILETDVDEKYYISDEKAKKIIEQAMERVDLKITHSCVTPGRLEKRQNGRRAKEEEEEMYTLTAQDIHGVIENNTVYFDEPLGRITGCVKRKDRIFAFKNDGKRGTAQEHVYLIPNETTADTCNTAHVQKIIESEMIGKLIDDQGRLNKGIKLHDISPCLKAEEHGNNKKVIEGQINVLGRLDMKGQDNIRRVYDTEGIAPTLTTSEGGHRQPKVLVEGNIGVTNHVGENIHSIDGISPTIKARDYKGPVKVVDAFRVRKLTPREYARLQGFPDNFEFVCSDSQMYKQFGNAVTVNVSKAIAESIGDFLS